MVLREDPALWTHALMDLGAAVCRPTPRCGDCPARSECTYAGRIDLVPEAPGARSRRVRGRQPSFESTSRWLRGRLLARLREAPEGAWQAPPQLVGSHGPDAIAAALRAMARDGLVEWDGGRARLPAAAQPAAAATDAQAGMPS
jgi:A/G-specific adenine glycosylase